MRTRELVQPKFYSQIYKGLWTKWLMRENQKAIAKGPSNGQIVATCLVITGCDKGKSVCASSNSPSRSVVLSLMMRILMGIKEVV